MVPPVIIGKREIHPTMVALAFIVTVLGLLWFGCEQRNQGAVREQIKAQDQKIAARETVIAALARQKARVDTVHAKAHTHYLAARATYDSNRTLGNADKALDACSVVLETCAGKVAVRDSIIGVRDGEVDDWKRRLDLEKKKHPSRFGCAGPLAATTQGVGLGVACGIRFP